MHDVPTFKKVFGLEQYKYKYSYSGQYNYKIIN